MDTGQHQGLPGPYLMTYFPESLHYEPVTSVEQVAATDALQLRLRAPLSFIVLPVRKVLVLHTLRVRMNL
jgi:hypothetical protein